MEKRCAWCEELEITRTYHDTEWGIPVHDDHKHFEFLMMEVMQCGLNWTMMLKKREIFRQCFDNFDYNKIVSYDDQKIQKIMNTPGMIKSIRKIQAVITNASAFLKIIEDYGSFDRFIWGYSGGKTLIYKSHQLCHVARNELSDEISKELKKRGFKYLGSITVYSHLQACGVINDHEESCFLYQEIIKNWPVEYREQGAGL